MFWKGGYLGCGAGSWATVGASLIPRFRMGNVGVEGVLAGCWLGLRWLDLGIYVRTVVCLGYCLPGLQDWVVEPQNTRRPGRPVYEPGMGAPPPRVVALGLGRQRQNAGSAAPGVGKVPGASVPMGKPDPIQDLHP